VLSSLIGLESTFAQISTDTIPVAPGKRDTVFIVKRDTVVVVQQQETVRIIKETSESNSQDQSSGYNTDDRDRFDRVERQRNIREERRREYEAWYAAQPVVRAGESWGYKFYPTALSQIDFPSIKFGIEKTLSPSLGVQGSLGILTPPADFLDTGFGRETGTARFGIRGLDFGFSGRYYLSHVKNRFPFYLAVETSYSISPVEIGIWTTSADGTFEQFLDAPVNAQRFYLGVLAGWELRTKEGLLLDLATGFRVGSKSIRSSNAQVQAIVNDTYWNLNDGGATAFATIVTRVGIGYGKWISPEKKANTTRKQTSKRKKKKRRRR